MGRNTRNMGQVARRLFQETQRWRRWIFGGAVEHGERKLTVLINSTVFRRGAEVEDRGFSDDAGRVYSIAEKSMRLQWQLKRLSIGQLAVARMGGTNGEWLCMGRR